MNSHHCFFFCFFCFFLFEQICWGTGRPAVAQIAPILADSVPGQTQCCLIKKTHNSARGLSMLNVVWGGLERVGCRVRPYEGINTWCHIGFCSDQGLLPTGEELRKDLLIYGIKKWIYFQSRLSTAIIRWGDSYCKEFIYFNVDCQLELEGESALHQERKRKQRRENWSF